MKEVQRGYEMFAFVLLPESLLFIYLLCVCVCRRLQFQESPRDFIFKKMGGLTEVFYPQNQGCNLYLDVCLFHFYFRQQCGGVVVHYRAFR